MKSKWLGWFDVRLRTREADDGTYVGMYEVWVRDGSNPTQVHEDGGESAQPCASQQGALDDARRRADAWCEANYQPNLR